MDSEPSTKTFSTTGLWQISGRSWPSWVDGVRSLDASTPRATKGRRPLGCLTSTRFFRSLSCVRLFQRRPVLTLRFQKELAITTNVTASTVCQDIVSTRITASDVRSGVMNTHITVSDNHHSALECPHDTHGQGRVVSATHTMPVTE